MRRLVLWGTPSEKQAARYRRARKFGLGVAIIFVVVGLVDIVLGNRSSALGALGMAVALAVIGWINGRLARGGSRSSKT